MQARGGQWHTSSCSHGHTHTLTRPAVHVRISGANTPFSLADYIDDTLGALEEYGGDFAFINIKCAPHRTRLQPLPHPSLTLPPVRHMVPTYESHATAGK